MASINLKKETYMELQQFIVLLIQERLKTEKDIFQLVKKKFGITFDEAVRELLKEYYKHRKTKS